MRGMCISEKLSGEESTKKDVEEAIKKQIQQQKKRKTNSARDAGHK